MRLSIIATSFRLPGNSQPDEFWSDLMASKDQSRLVPKNRFCLDGGGHPDYWGTFIEAPFVFDFERFSIEKDELPWIDPQQRLLLTCTAEAFETIDMSPSAHRIGVFVGASNVSYADRVAEYLYSCLLYTSDAADE